MKLPSLDELREVSGLSGVRPQQVHDVFKKHAPNGFITREVFSRCFRELNQTESSGETMDVLFTLFDVDENGIVDLAELASGISVLCGGTRDEKVKMSFDLFDLDHSGFITKDEMITYLTSIFTVLFETSPETRIAESTTPNELAKATTEQCFLDADLNKDGLLSFAEFKRWYALSGQGKADAASAATLFPDSLEELCRWTNLRAFAVDDIASFFKEFTETDSLDVATFVSVFRLLRQGTGFTQQQEEIADGYVRSLFGVFDVNQNGLVDQAELLSGLSVLCHGTPGDRVRAAFALFDSNGDGAVQGDEATSALEAFARSVGRQQRRRL